MDEKLIEVYVVLLEEGTDTIRGTQAIDLGNGLAKLLPTHNYDPEDEIWEFLPGSVVRVKEVNNGGEKLLLAVKDV